MVPGVIEARAIIGMASIVEYQFAHLQDGETLHPDITPEQSRDLRDQAVALLATARTAAENAA